MNEIRRIERTYVSSHISQRQIPRLPPLNRTLPSPHLSQPLPINHIHLSPPIRLLLRPLNHLHSPLPILTPITIQRLKHFGRNPTRHIRDVQKRISEW